MLKNFKLGVNLKTTLYRNCSYKQVKRPNLLNPVRKTAPQVEPKADPRIRLFNQLKARILTTGPLTIADYMKEVLTNPVAGYYMNRDVFGSKGDFITSPEINQIFGELIAVWCVAEWRKLGSPSPFQLVELGPGRGTLSRDILKVLSHFKLHKEFSIHFVEISPHLSKLQAQNMCYKFNDADESELYYRKGETVSGTNVFWYRQIEDVPKEFSIVLAHEFFDALPIHKLQKHDGVWKEILVDIDPEDKNSFRFVISKSQTPISKIYKEMENEPRQCLEFSTETAKIITGLTERFERDGGFGLVMDYGHFGDKTDTFRSFKDHKLHDPLVEPGSADLTADVDFKQMKETAEENGRAITFGPVEQGEFMKKMEGEIRLEILLENCLPENKENIKSGYKMLTDGDQMGKRFKFFSIFPAVVKDHLAKFPVSGFN